MVFSNVSKNFNNTLKSKPPLVVFTVCILGIIVTTLSLAYYVHTQDKIFNIDARDDWLSLLQYLNKYDVCIQNTSESVLKSTNRKTHRTADMVSIVSFAKLKKLSSNQEMNVEGYVSLEGWSSKCPDRTGTPPPLQIAFILPNSTEEETVCVMLTGPADFMPKLAKQASCGHKSNTKWGKLTTKPSNVENEFCSSGSLGKLQYDLDYSKNLKFDMFISEEDRLVINSHLIVTSCFLVFLVILITCYALIKSRTSSNGGDSKQLLMAKGMYL